MEADNDCGDMIPIYENISISPSIISDHGDIFQCGKCKQNFSNIIDFLSHKKEHSEEQKVCHILNGYPTNIIALSQTSNEIWLVREQTSDTIAVRDDCEVNFLTSTNTDIQEMKHDHFFQSNFIDETQSNFKCSENPTPALITDKETEDYVNSLSCFSCFTCGGCFETDAQLTDHINIHIPVEPQQLPSSSVQEKPTKQRKVKNSNKIFQCVICGRVFANTSALKKHSATHKVWSDGLCKTLSNLPSDGDSHFQCPYCQNTFKTYLNLRSHLGEHKHEKVFKCIQGECAAMFMDLNSLISHISVHHQVTEYHCHVCDAVQPTLELIADHQKTHSLHDNSIKNTFKCEYCKATFKRHYHLKHHLDTANHNIECKHCGKSYSSERSLRKHLLQHDETKSYKCTTCKASFKLKQYLLSHLVTHSNEKYFACSVCDKGFKRIDLLARHVKLHQPEKRKHCPYRSQLNCMAEFTRTDKLNNHIKTHSEKLQVVDNHLQVIIVPALQDTML